MTEFRARIGRIRMKNGGADVHVLNGFTPPDNDEAVEATLFRTAREIVADPVSAFMLVAFAPDGRTFFNWRWTDGSPISRTMMVPYIAELARRYVISREEASERFDEMFQWVDG
jgi:hypothetical protein